MFPLYDTNPHHRVPWVTLLIILANLVVHLLLSNQTVREQGETIARYGFVPQRIKQLEDPDLVVRVKLPTEQLVAGKRQHEEIRLPADPAQIGLSLITTMFLHGGWFHLLGNMWFLWLFGNNVEDRLGHLSYILFYLVGGILATICHYLTDPQSTIPVVGASGAVSAVLGGYAVTYPRAKVRCLVFIVVVVFFVDVPALVVLGFWFLQELFSGLGMLHGGVDVSVAFWAHIGGFVAGALIMLVLNSIIPPPPETSWHEELEQYFRATNFML